MTGLRVAAARPMVPSARRKGEERDGLGAKAPGSPGHPLLALGIPDQQRALVCVKGVYGNVDQGLQDVIQIQVPVHFRVGAIERLQFAHAALRLFVEPRVFDGDRRLVGQGLEDLDVGLVERIEPIALDV